MTEQPVPPKPPRKRRAAAEDASSNPTAGLPVAKDISMRRQPSQDRALQTIDAVLAAAGKEIEQGGLDRLTTRRVAATAGLSVGAVYEYFPNKQAILAALIGRWMDAIFEVVDSARPKCGAGLDVFSYVDLVLDQVIALYEGQPGLGALFRMLSAVPSLSEFNQRHSEKVWRSMAAALAQGAPRADPADVEAAAITMMVSCDAILSAAIVYGAGDKARMIHNLRVCMATLLSRLVMPV